MLTIEYWDIERKRYPQYDHCAVIVAEDITARFLNVISLFNGTIPLMAIQMSALRIGDNVTPAKKNNLRLELRLPEFPETTNQLEESGLDIMEYDKRWRRYRVRLVPGDVQAHRELLTRLLKLAYDRSQ